MTWDPQRRAFVCGRGQRCSGTGRAVVVKRDDGGRVGRRQCPVCRRVDLLTYTSDDGRELLLPH